MGWFWPFYLTMAVLAFVPRLFLDRDPLFLYAPPSHFWWLRIKALLNPKEEFPPFTRGLLLFRLCLFMFNQASSRNFTGFQWPQEIAVRNHLLFWKLFFAKEMELFNGPGVDKKTFVQLSFKEYCLGPDKVVKQLYTLWGLPLHMEMLKALSDSKKEHDSYKQVHKYRNPSLTELGLSLEIIEERFKEYIKTVNVGVSHKIKTAPPLLPPSLSRGVSLMSNIASPSPPMSPMATEGAGEGRDS
ncbi:sulfotransferase [Nannochloropsis oceanica]